MVENSQILNNQNIRDEKIFNLTLLGWSKTRIAKELKISRSTVTTVIHSDFGQEKLAEMYDCIEQPLMALPEMVGLSLQQVKSVLNGSYSVERSKVILDAAKLVLGVSLRFKELEQDNYKNVQAL